MIFSFLRAKVRSTNSKEKYAGIRAVLDFFDKEKLYPEFRRIERGANATKCVVAGKEYAQFASNNYLSLSNNPEVIKAAKKAIEENGIGPGGSRVVSGDLMIVRELESSLTELLGTEDTLTFPTGYMANIAVFQALMDPMFNNLPQPSSASVIFSDEYNHGSIIDGCRLSKAKKIVFKHDDIDDLVKKIKENSLPNKLVVTEGVFSTDGEIINIPNYVEVAREYNAKLMVDDAHGIGILGEHGGGVAEKFNCSSEVDIWMGSLDKAFGSTGGYLSGSSELIRYLRIACRSSILSSAIPASIAGGVTKAIELVKNGEKTRSKLFKNSERLKAGLVESGFKVLGKDNLPAIPVLIGDEQLSINFTSKLMEAGYYTMAFRWPAVPQGKSRLRLTVMADHTERDIDGLIEACVKIGRELRVIG
jgi:8-amino-7-oxononanoate synthase